MDFLSCLDPRRETSPLLKSSYLPLQDLDAEKESPDRTSCLKGWSDESLQESLNSGKALAEIGFRTHVSLFLIDEVPRIRGWGGTRDWYNRVSRRHPPSILAPHLVRLVRREDGIERQATFHVHFSASNWSELLGTVRADDLDLGKAYARGREISHNSLLYIHL